MTNALRQAAKGGYLYFLSEAARQLGIESKATILYGENLRDRGMALELFEIGPGENLLDGLSLDLYASRKRAGIGIAKDIYKNTLIEIDAGVYVTDAFNNIIRRSFDPKMSIGVSFRREF